MAYKRYTRQFLGPFALLIALVFALAYCAVIEQWYLTSAILLSLIIVLIIYLQKQLDSVNTQLARIFEQSRGKDFSARLATKSTDASIKLLYKEINRWQEYIQELQQAKAQAQSVTNEILNHLPVGVFLMNDNMQLAFSNEIARGFLNYRAKADEAQLEYRAPHLFKHLGELKKAGRLELNLDNKGEKQRWQLTYRKFSVDSRAFELFIAQNVQANLERTQGRLSEEIMHVLTHEIMNSISPVHSLIDTLNLQLQKLSYDGSSLEMDQEVHQDLLTGASIIKKRSEGLMQFVERYGMLASLPKLEVTTIELDQFLEDLEKLISSELADHQVKFELQVLDKKMRMRGDQKLLEQVIINLIKNAREAVNTIEGGRVVLSFSKGDGYNYISVTDNGGGVDSEIQDKIFLPFFTTKKRGSGIGLSLSRKIIDAHNGRLYLRQSENNTEFRVEIPD